MRTSRPHQPLTYDVRLPDEAQADALRLLDASKAVVNQALTLLWPDLDEFGRERVGPAWKQVGKYMGSPQYHGDRQWRCESETVGRILRQQAERKKAFELVQPILSDGFIRPKTEKRPAGKNRPAIKEAVTSLQKSLEEVETIIPLPDCLKERLDDGELMAPSLREERRADGERFAVLDFIVDVEKEVLPAWESVERVLGADWGVHTLLTATAVDEHNEQVGRPMFLNTGGFDGRQARTRRQIDELKKKAATYEQERDVLPSDHPKRAWFNQRLALYRREIDRCWRKYEQRNRALAHLASNVLLLLCQVHGCSLLSMESLKTLKTTARGKGVRGRWSNYRNNATIRGEIWRLLRYKCHLLGLRFHTQQPRYSCWHRRVSLLRHTCGARFVIVLVG